MLACANLAVLDEGRGRELLEQPPKVKGSFRRAESLRQKDRGPEGVLESSTRYCRSAPTG